ncbi:hypothetical protein CSX00_06360 [Pseudobutyrivibrio ruminis]|uniref:Methyltransferase domain-containing protein n=1 Tax=Pseudobutyrivibrio ruminis TaxID=46206 RepID=A0A2G3EAY8_9FIRM|nr:class I SAM-dependent methyltransferase [Pseudobutyrivibrio ruminis]PHU40387.1 hypothetical protein CSX00_06360 [Pseudobutyrivibrio ruminis]
MSYNSSLYDSEYYASHLGSDYSRGHGWEEIFARQASFINRDLHPKKTLDVGCAVGYLVEGLRDLGVEAYGIDISEYAISQVRDDIKPFCKVQNASENKIEEKYDLITCIEVLEHLSLDDIERTINNICNATDMVIFSSTPFDYDEESHFSVNKMGFWSEKFAANGFYHDLDYDCSYIAPQSVLYRKRDYSKNELIRNYENKCFDLWNQNCILRDKVNLRVAQISDLDRGNIEQAQERARLLEEINNKNEEIANIKKEQADKYALALEELYEKYDSMHDKVIKQREYIGFLQQEMSKSQTVAIVKHRKKNISISRFLATRKMMKLPYDYWNPVFNPESYRKYNNDLPDKIRNSDKKLLKHFIQEGMYEARRASEIFDVNAYLRYNPDVKELFGYDLSVCYRHYIENGMKENRKSY